MGGTFFMSTSSLGVQQICMDLDGVYVILILNA